MIDETAAPPPARAVRLRVALLIGIASAAFTYTSFAHARVAPDFAFWWTAARELVAGRNPYLAVANGAGWPLPDPLFYPLPAVLAATPLAWLPLPAAGAVAMGIAGALLAWGLSADGLHRLWLFASAPYLMALKQGQWSPLILAAAFLPALGWLAAAKPTIGAAVLCYRPTWKGVAGVVLLALASFLVLPSWLHDWLANLEQLEAHPAPILTLVGPLLLLALLRWRTRESRLLLAMACVPQHLFFADQLPLLLVARTRRESAALTLASLVAWAGWFVPLRQGDLYVEAAAPWVLALLYLPALAVVVLRKPAATAATGSAVQT